MRATDNTTPDASGSASYVATPVGTAFGMAGTVGVDRGAVVVGGDVDGGAISTGGIVDEDTGGAELVVVVGVGGFEVEGGANVVEGGGE